MSEFYVSVGDQVSFSKTVGESDIYLFAGNHRRLSGNHVDEEFMKRSVYGRRIAHGVLLVGYMSTCSTMMIARASSTASGETPVSLRLRPHPLLRRGVYRRHDHGHLPHRRDRPRAAPLALRDRGAQPARRAGRGRPAHPEVDPEPLVNMAFPKIAAPPTARRSTCWPKSSPRTSGRSASSSPTSRRGTAAGAPCPPRARPAMRATPGATATGSAASGSASIWPPTSGPASSASSTSRRSAWCWSRRAPTTPTRTTSASSSGVARSHYSTSPAIQRYAALALRAADRLRARLITTRKGAYIASWGPLADLRGRKSSAIDTMANLPLLYWAADQADDGSFRLAAEAHAQMTRAAFVRADFSTYHAVEYDLASGERTRGFTFQGAFDESCWPRGQAWAIYGFSATARATGKPSIWSWPSASRTTSSPASTTASCLTGILMTPRSRMRHATARRARSQQPRSWTSQHSIPTQRWPRAGRSRPAACSICSARTTSRASPATAGC